MNKEKWLERKRIFDRIHRTPTTMVDCEEEIVVMLAAGLIELKIIEWYKITEEGRAYDEAMEKALPLEPEHILLLTRLDMEKQISIDRNSDKPLSDLSFELQIMGLVELFDCSQDIGLYVPAIRLTSAGRTKVELLKRHGEIKNDESNE